MCAHDGRPQPHRTGCSREGARARSVTTVVGDRNAWVRVRKIIRANARLRVAVNAHEGAKTRSTGRNVRQRRIFQSLFPGSGKPMIGIFVVRRKCVKGKNELGMFDIARRHCVPSRDMRPTQSRAARRREKKPKPPLDAEAAAAFVHDRAGRAEGAVRVAFKGVELRDGEALSATLDAAARLRVSTLNLSNALGLLSAEVIAKAFIDSARRCDHFPDEVSLAETPSLGRATEASLDDDGRLGQELVEAMVKSLVRSKKVILSKCSLGGAFVRVLGEVLAKVATSDGCRCESVNLRDNEADEASFESLLRACTVNTGIHEVILTNNRKLSQDQVARLTERCRLNALEDVLKRAVSTQRRDPDAVSFRKLNMQDEDVLTCVVPFLEQCPEVTTLDLRDNALTEVGMNALCSHLTPRIASVNLSGNPGFGSEAFQCVVGRAAANFVTANVCDEALKSVSDRHLGNIGAMLVAEAVASKGDDIRAIGFHHNVIGDSGCSAIVNALREKHSSLRELALYTNLIGPVGAAALSELIKVHPTLEVLDVGGNKMGDEGCLVIAQALEESAMTSKLVELHLDHNDISEEVAQALKRAVKTRFDAGRPLRALWLHGNNLSEDSVADIATYCSIDLDVDVESICAKVVESVDSPPRDEEIMLAEREAIRASAMRGNNSSHLANRIAAHVGAHYRARCGSHFAATRGTAVIAGIVAFDASIEGPDNLVILSLGVGTKFIPPGVAASLGRCASTHEVLTSWDNHVHDSHAEVLARRGLLRVLYRDIEAYLDRGESALLEGAPDGKLAVKSSIRLYLYVSTAPCGAASAGPRGTQSSPWTESVASHQTHSIPHRNRLWFGASYKGTADDPKTPTPPGCVPISSAADAVGVPGKVLSCSDKIARWHTLGLQGALLTHFLHPVRLTGVVVGRKFDFDRCTFATCCRNRIGDEAQASHPWMLHSPINIEGGGIDSSSGGRELAGDGDESISWALGEGTASAHDGRTGTALGGVGTISICSRAVLWHQFSRLVERIKMRGLSCDITLPHAENWTYDGLKRASPYHSARRTLYSLGS